MLSFSPVVGIGTPPTPNSQASVLPSLCFWGRGALAGERGGWESSNFDEGTYDVILFMYMYFVGETDIEKMGNGEKKRGLGAAKSK